MSRTHAAFRILGLCRVLGKCTYLFKVFCRNLSIAASNMGGARVAVAKLAQLTSDHSALFSIIGPSFSPWVNRLDGHQKVIEVWENRSTNTGSQYQCLSERWNW